MNAVVVFLLVTFSVWGTLYALLQPQLQRQAAFDQRRALLVGSRGVGGSAAAGGKTTGTAYDALLRELKAGQKATRGARSSLRIRLQQAGLAWTRARYISVCAASGGVAFLALLILGLAVPLAAVLAAGAGGILPHLYVKRRRNQRFHAFTEAFPDALDVVIRGVKSGLPLADCLRIIAAESQEPVKSEFRKLVEDQTLGMTSEDAVQRLFERMPLPETSFFAIVITIQCRTGGNLSEALGNLSRVLRERKKMREKIKAMSSEAKTSAGIIAILPFAVSGFVYLTSPDYISLLFTTTLGNVVLLACGLWMLTGVLVMRKLINFDM